MGFPTEVRSDRGPGFCGGFNLKMGKLGISHHYSSPYVFQANGFAEKAIGNIKMYLAKLGSMNKPNLQGLLYRLNNTPSSVVSISSFLWSQREVFLTTVT